jgi:hypothetical protein
MSDFDWIGVQWIERGLIVLVVAVILGLHSVHDVVTGAPRRVASQALNSMAAHNNALLRYSLNAAEQIVGRERRLKS